MEISILCNCVTSKNDTDVIIMNAGLKSVIHSIDYTTIDYANESDN